MKNNPKYIENFNEFKKVYEGSGKESKPVIVFVGPPGCGKGTQSKIICDKLGYVHVSTGDILRKSEDPEIKEMMTTGKLLPDEIVGSELKRFLKSNKSAEGFVFDGYPRNIKQKNILDKILDQNDLEITSIFYLNVPEKILKERIKERGKTSGRKDDEDPEVFKIRMKEFADQTFPMIKSMKKSKHFYEIDGEMDLDEITDEILIKMNEI